MQKPVSTQCLYYRLGIRMATVAPVNIYIYWDNLNIFVESQNVAENEPNQIDIYRRVRIDLTNLLLLAHGSRHVRRIVAVDSVPPKLEPLWDKMRKGVQVEKMSSEQ